MWRSTWIVPCKTCVSTCSTLYKFKDTQKLESIDTNRDQVKGMTYDFIKIERVREIYAYFDLDR